MPLDKKRLYISHAIGISYALATGYHLLVHEYLQGGYFSYRFIRREAFPIDITSFYVIPLGFWAMAFGFAFLYYVFGIERNVGTLFRQTILSGLIIYFYIILLTLPLDTPHGDFYWPLESSEFPYKAEYVFGVILVLFLSLYLFIMKCVVKGNRSLGYFSTPVFYLPFLPFVYQIFPSVHASLLFGSALLGYFFSTSKFNLDHLKKVIKEINPIYWLVIISVVSGLFRFWHLYYFAFVLNIEELPGLAADGGNYYQHAMSFVEGKPLVGLHFTPAYGFLLSVFLRIFDSNLLYTLIVQGLFCAFIPILVYFICRSIFDYKIALTASLCAALSYQLIFYSVVVHRSCMAVFFHTAVVLLAMLSLQKLRWTATILLGFCAGWLVLLDAARAPVLLIALVPIFKSLKVKTAAQYFSLLCLGFVVAQTPFSQIIYKDYETVWPLGRPGTLSEGQAGGWLVLRGEEMIQLGELGFNPFESLTGSLLTLASNPLEVGKLIVKKTSKEFMDFFYAAWDPIYLDPIKLNEDSYFASCLTVYFFPIFLLGGTAFFLSKRMNWEIKVVLGFPVLYSIFFFTVIYYSKARHAVVVLPLILIWFALGLHELIKYLFQYEPNRNFDEVGLMSLVPGLKRGFDTFLKRKSKLNRIGFVGGLLLAIFLMVEQTRIWRSPPFDIKKVRFLNSAFNTRKNLLNIDFAIPRAGSYNLFLRVKKPFGSLPPTDTSVKLYLNDTYWGMKPVPIPSSVWVSLENLAMEKGFHRLSFEFFAERTMFSPLYLEKLLVVEN